MVVGRPDGLEALSRQQEQWQTLEAKLSGGITQAYLVSPGATSPRLDFHTEPREDVKVAAARIGLAETTLVVDAQGAIARRPSSISTMPPSSFSKSSCPRAPSSGP